MRLLLDTQIVQMLVSDESHLSQSEQRIINYTHHRFAISAISLWEMGAKWQTLYRSGSRKGEADPATVVEALDLADFPYQSMPLTFAHSTAILEPSFDYNDPFDCFLLAQAQLEGMRLLTRDGKFEHHRLALYA